VKRILLVLAAAALMAAMMVAMAAPAFADHGSGHGGGTGVPGAGGFGEGGTVAPCPQQGGETTVGGQGGGGPGLNIIDQGGSGCGGGST